MNTLFDGTLFDIRMPPPESILGDRAGETYERKRDLKRLNAQAQRVWDVMADWQWHSLRDISERTGDPEASVSARLRDFRRPEFGGFNIERLFISKGLWNYRMERKP